MTTNIFDANTSVMAADSRWSIEYGPWLLYLDDTGYEKIERINGRSLMFAGDGRKIQQFKDWFKSNPKNFSGMPDPKGMAVCIVIDETGMVRFKQNQDIDSENVLCAGSGSYAAYKCWTQNKCPKTAVETAKQRDCYSGGEVKFIEFKTKETNVASVFPTAPIRIEEVTRNIIMRGIAMKIQNLPIGTPNLPFPKAGSETVNDDLPPREEMNKLVASGELSATAPCDGMYNDWSVEDQEKFKGALSEMFGW